MNMNTRTICEHAAET